MSTVRPCPRGSHGSALFGEQSKWGESFLEAMVLEHDDKCSFSFLPLQILTRRLEACVAVVLIFSGANSFSGCQEVFVVFALSPLLPLPPCPS